MSNLDKDIEVIKDICYDDKGEKMYYIDISSSECEEFIQAIENILKELNKKDGKIALLNLAEISLETQNEDLKAKLETYKKIAEILSQKLLDTYNDKKIFGIDNIVCTKMENRDEFDICRPDVKCTDCIIEWARNEVNMKYLNNEKHFKTTIKKDELNDAFKNVDFNLDALIDTAVKAKYKDNELKCLKYIIKKLKQENSKLKIEIKNLKNKIGFLEIDNFRFQSLAGRLLDERNKRNEVKKDEFI